MDLLSATVRLSAQMADLEAEATFEGSPEDLTPEGIRRRRCARLQADVLLLLVQANDGRWLLTLAAWALFTYGMRERRKERQNRSLQAQ